MILKFQKYIIIIVVITLFIWMIPQIHLSEVEERTAKQIAWEYLSDEIQGTVVEEKVSVKLMSKYFVPYNINGIENDKSISIDKLELVAKVTMPTTYDAY